MKKKNKDKGINKNELYKGEPHPSAYDAKKYLISLGPSKLMVYLEAYSSCAIEGDNRMAEICGETLNRLIQGKPVSDRYILGLAWSIRNMEEGKV